ncbi:NRDE family protein [Serpentinicella sp. ANB-PHB4]|uniref:NRDE family protein n=1 Tax=Serpentinicella sp. ANB-PHB4 TaxID=3074076 RepID=UPI0028663E1E|nr:NRDE family protein [Serpentinicella sp. ANB-PHB4]MDR5658984.1 NRDE family protein [Serpentinicella sp. ANB-PHB4]
MFAYKVHPKYPLLLIGNRDEFYNRPTKHATFWDDHPQILAGRDLEKNGTWLGITKEGRFAALTNFRDPNKVLINSRSRGELVSSFLKSSTLPEKYLDDIKKSHHLYQGFNLLVGNVHELHYYSKLDNKAFKLAPGIYGLSNHSLDTPWPKVTLGKKLISEAITYDSQIHSKLFDILKNDERPPDINLPNTDVGLKWERLLSSIYIKSHEYGTRAMTVLSYSKDNKVTFIEKSLLQERDKWIESFYHFYLK